MSSANNPADRFNWGHGTELDWDVDTDAFLEESDINEFDWDLAVWWNTELARVSRTAWENAENAVDHLPDKWKANLRLPDRVDVDAFIEDVLTRIPRSEVRVVDHLELVVSHVLRAVDDVTGKPFMAYDASTGTWRREGEWVSSRGIGTSVASFIDHLIGKFEAAMHRSVDLVYDMIDDVAPDPGPKPQGAAVAAWQAQVDRRKRLRDKVKDAHDMAKSIPRDKHTKIKKILRDRLAINQTHWDSDMRWLVVKDGVIDLEHLLTRKRIQLEDFSPFHLTTMALDVSYDESRHVKAGSSEWEKGVAKLLPDASVRVYLQKRYGAALLGNPGEVGKSMVWQYGEPDTGKSTIQEVIAGAKGIFAPYAVQADADALTKRGVERGATERFAAYARGKRYAIMSELDDGVQLGQGKFKNLVGGETVQGTAKYSNSVSYHFTATLFMSSNHTPSLPYGDTATAERIHVVPFETKMVAKSKVSPEEWAATPVERRAEPGWMTRIMSDPIERAAVLRWVLDGLLMFAQEGLDELPARVVTAGREFVLEGDPVATVLRSLLGEGDDGMPQRIALYKDADWMWLEKDGILLKRFDQLFEDRAIELGLIKQLDGVPRKQLMAARKMLHSMGGSRKKINVGHAPDGRPLSDTAFSRVRELESQPAAVASAIRF